MTLLLRGHAMTKVPMRCGFTIQILVVQHALYILQRLAMRSFLQCTACCVFQCCSVQLAVCCMSVGAFRLSAAQKCRGCVAGQSVRHHLLTNYFHAILTVVLAQFSGLGFLDGMEGIIRLAEASSYIRVHSRAADICCVPVTCVVNQLCCLVQCSASLLHPDALCMGCMSCGITHAGCMSWSIPLAHCVCIT